MKHSGKEIEFCHFIQRKLLERVKLNKRDTEKFAVQFGIFDKNAVKELCELAIVKRARGLINGGVTTKGIYDAIVELYRSQVNLSHRTSQSVMLQQYSTPAPIAFLAGTYIWSNKQGKGYYFEPSAGNGLLTIALPMQQTTVNEIDEFRSMNLAEHSFAQQLRQDATEPFIEFVKNFDGIITNPPFGKLDKTVIIGNFPINTLDHIMAIRALDCMRDDGRAAIIIGGHTEWDTAGRIKAGKNRVFFSYLYRFYNVADVINIDGDLYSRQGTSFNVRLILIDGRKAKPEGYPPLKDTDDKEVKDFETLYQRVSVLIDNDNKRLRIAKAKAIAKLRILELLDMKNGVNGCPNRKECLRLMKKFDKKDIYTTQTRSVSDFKGFLEQCKRAINKLYGHKVGTKEGIWSWYADDNAYKYILDKNLLPIADRELYLENRAEYEKAKELSCWEFLKKYGFIHIEDGYFCVDFEFDETVFAAYSSKALIDMGVYTKEEINQYVDCSLLISE